MNITKGLKLGSWTTIKKIGQGGNSYVWKVSNSNGVIGALKTPRPGAKRYKRFIQETEIQNKLTGHIGVLPALDHYAPAKLVKNEIAWLVTPFAKTIEKKLKKSKLNEVITCILSIAQTLSELAEKEKTSHRDIKPQNMFWFKGKAVLGDFGLADFPGKKPLTKIGERIGALHFIAPEMLIDATNADPYPGDVYSLAKTMWVLATGYRYALGGQMRTDIDQFRLSSHVIHQRAYFLDDLIEKATDHHPSERPTMNEFASELKAWFALQDDSSIKPALSSKIHPIMSAFEKDAARKSSLRNYANQLCDRVVDRLSSIAEEQRKLEVPASKVEKGIMISDVSLLTRMPGGRKIRPHNVALDLRDPQFSISMPGARVSLWIGVGMKLLTSGSLHTVAAMIVREQGNPPREIWASYKMGVGGTSECELALNASIDELHANMGWGLDQFSELAAEMIGK